MLEPAELEALILSLRVAGVATLVCLAPGLWLGYWLARTTRPWRTAVDVLVVLPLVLPPVVLGYALLQLFGRGGLVGAWLHESLGLSLAFRWQGAALAAAVVGFPLMVRTMRQAFEAVDPGLEQAAAILGANRPGVWFSVTLPLAARGCLAGVLLCFARALGEFGATITFAGNVPGETRTLPLAIWTALQTPGAEDSAWRATLWCLALAVAATVACEWLVGRRGRTHARG